MPKEPKESKPEEAKTEARSPGVQFGRMEGERAACGCRSFRRFHPHRSTRTIFAGSYAERL